MAKHKKERASSSSHGAQHIEAPSRVMVILTGDFNTVRGRAHSVHSVLCSGGETGLRDAWLECDPARRFGGPLSFHCFKAKQASACPVLCLCWCYFCCGHFWCRPNAVNMRDMHMDWILYKSQQDGENPRDIEVTVESVGLIESVGQVNASASDNDEPPSVPWNISDHYPLLCNFHIRVRRATIGVVDLALSAYSINNK